ncbi:MAG TPA: DUF2950 domain-containing protein [Casimicrobiaceae bacterium]|jgi:hypothetical protein|nr:DUF2950 domain-containing protein [Casimicrobiaceae bacterium]
MRHSSRRWLMIFPAALCTLLTAGASPAIAADAAANQQPQVQQRFATPEAATEALVAAIRAENPRRIGAVLGPGSDRLINSGDIVADRQGRARFVAAFDKHSRIELEGDAKATLIVGENDWPLPFPLIRHADGWRFDAKSGAEEILNRRIGRNELAAIQVCLAYVDAQREYALTQGNRDGMHEYAMQLVSTPGKKDGLYWPTKEGQPLSPLGPLAAKAKEEGYGTSASSVHAPYHGYSYRILTSQGGDAPGGGYDYVSKGKMIGGFALVAYPARWGTSGVMTLIVNHDGAVYEKNLGKETAAIASKMTRFNPDSTWSRAQP